MELNSYDPTQVVTEARAEVERRRASGQYPSKLLSSLRAELELGDDGQPLEVLASVQLHRAIPRPAGFAGWAAHSLKRAIRRAVAWYVLPMLTDQLNFNRAVVSELRRADRRLTRLEPPWHRDSHEPQLESGVELRDKLLRARVDAVLTAMDGVSEGPILVVGPWRRRIEAALDANGFLLGHRRDPEDDSPDVLEVGARGNHAAVVALGVLPMLPPAELVRLPSLAYNLLSAHGRLIVDGFDDRGALAFDEVDHAVLRWLSPDSLERLLRPAGFACAVITRESLERPAVNWFALVAQRGPE